MQKRNDGISLISLIITIIVIIILAAIVIFTGLETPNSANFAKFASEFSDFNLAVDNAYMKEFTNNALNNQTRSKAQIYYKLATGEDVGMSGEVESAGDVSRLETMFPEGLKGNEYYLVTDDKNVEGWTKQKQYFASTEKHYITDEGEAFCLPGYLIEEDGVKKWWVNERKYYISENPITVGNAIKITTDANGKTLAENNIEEGTTLYINFDASEDGSPVTVSPSLPYAVTTNGTYEFTITYASGKTIKYEVKINNYKEKTLASTIGIGDYVEYAGDSTNSYTLDSSKTGYSAGNGTVLKPRNTTWRVWDKKADGSIVIMPIYPVSDFYLEGATGFVNSVEVIEAVCDLYTNASLGITASDVRSLKIEDLEEARVTSNMVAARDSFVGNVAYGKTNKETWGYNGYTSGNFYMESDGKTIIETPNIASSTNPIIMKQTAYENNNPLWNSLENSKFSSETYGTLLGDGWSWLASTSVYLGYNDAFFDVIIASGSDVSNHGLYFSNGGTNKGWRGIRPLVSLRSTLQVDKSDTTRDGSTPDKAWKIIKK